MLDFEGRWVDCLVWPSRLGGTPFWISEAPGGNKFCGKIEGKVEGRRHTAREGSVSFVASPSLPFASVSTFVSPSFSSIVPLFLSFFRFSVPSLASLLCWLGESFFDLEELFPARLDFFMRFASTRLEFMAASGTFAVVFSAESVMLGSEPRDTTGAGPRGEV